VAGEKTGLPTNRSSAKFIGRGPEIKKKLKGKGLPRCSDSGGTAERTRVRLSTFATRKEETGKQKRRVPKTDRQREEKNVVFTKKKGRKGFQTINLSRKGGGGGSTVKGYARRGKDVLFSQVRSTRGKVTAPTMFPKTLIKEWTKRGGPVLNGGLACSGKKKHLAPAHQKKK